MAKKKHYAPSKCCAGCEKLLTADYAGLRAYAPQLCFFCAIQLFFSDAGEGKLELPNPFIQFLMEMLGDDETKSIVSFNGLLLVHEINDTLNDRFDLMRQRIVATSGKSIQNYTHLRSTIEEVKAYLIELRNTETFFLQKSSKSTRFHKWSHTYFHMDNASTLCIDTPIELIVRMMFTDAVHRKNRAVVLENFVSKGPEHRDATNAQAREKRAKEAWVCGFSRSEMAKFANDVMKDASVDGHIVSFEYSLI